MTEKKRPGRGLADISHYFITEKPAPPSSPEPQPVSFEPETPPARPSKHFFLIGSRSAEARALVACNLACEWSRRDCRVEVVEGESKIPNSHFLMGSLFPENGEGKTNGHSLWVRLDGVRSIELSLWNGGVETRQGQGKQVLWNGPFPSLLKELSRADGTPQILLILEPDRSKLMEAYLELRQAASLRPDARFVALVYSRGSKESAQPVYSFFQEMALKYLQVPVRNAGELRWDLVLAKSILARLPAVLQPEESGAKETLRTLAITLLNEELLV